MITLFNIKDFAIAIFIPILSVVQQLLAYYFQKGSEINS